MTWGTPHEWVFAGTRAAYVFVMTRHARRLQRENESLRRLVQVTFGMDPSQLQTPGGMLALIEAHSPVGMSTEAVLEDLLRVARARREK